MSCIYDAVVVGGGIFGSWASIALAETGEKNERIALLDRYEPGHEHGSSHGDGRIYRIAYAEEIYIDMMKFAIPHWKRLDVEEYRDDETSLRTHTGCLVMDSKDGGWSVGPIRKLLKSLNHPFDDLSPHKLTSQFPAISPCEGRDAIYIHEGGLLRASNCVRAAWKKSQKLGIHTISNFKVVDIKIGSKRTGESDKYSTNDLITVFSADGRALNCRKIVLSPGAWLPELMSKLFNINLKATVTEETVCYFKPYSNLKGTPNHGPRETSLGGVPVFLAEIENGLNDMGYYGVPDLGWGLKVGAHCTGHPITNPDHDIDNDEEKKLDGRKESANAIEVTESCSMFVRKHFPYLNPVPVKKVTCLYTCSPSEDFIISTVPGFDDKIVVVGCGSGHGFKFGPSVGFCAAALLRGKDPPVPLSRFRIDKVMRES